MTRRDWFDVIVRTAGLVLALYGAYLAVCVFWSFVSALIGGNYHDYRLTSTFIWWGGPSLGYFFSGWLLMRQSHRVVGFAYGNSRPGFCENCGYDLRGSPDRCPECGAVPVRKAKQPNEHAAATRSRPR